MIRSEIKLKDGRVLKDLQLNSRAYPQSVVTNPSHITLTYLGLCEPTAIPLQLCSGPFLHVESTDVDTRTWLCQNFAVDVLERSGIDLSTVNSDSDSCDETPVGILLKNENSVSLECPHGSEVLIYGIRGTLYERYSDVSFKPVQAGIALSSYESDYGPMMLHALFLSGPSIVISTTTQNVEPLPPPPNKRDRLMQLFDEAADARKRPRLSTDGRERSMSRASSVMTSPTIPQDGFAIDTLSASNHTAIQAITEPNGPQSNRRVSGSALTAARTNSPTSLSAPTEARPPSRARTLERTGTLLSQSFTADTMLEQQITNRNKEVISRAVLAGMKNYGLKTYKAGKKGHSSDSQAPETVETPIDNESAQVVEADPKDVEYKNVYHQTNKGVVFAFRKSIGSTMLRQEAIKEAVDALLAIFCVEPG